MTEANKQGDRERTYSYSMPGEQFNDRGLSALHVTDRRLIRLSDRYRCEHLSTACGCLFYKAATEGRYAPQIARQVEGTSLLKAILAKNEVLDVEDVVAHGAGWLATRWLDCRPIAENTDQFILSPDRVTTERYGYVLAEMDKVTADMLPQTTTTPRLDYRFRLEEMREWVDARLDRSSLQPSVKDLVMSAVDHIDARSHYLEPTIQHGDLTPDHILACGKRYVLIDTEYTSTNWPRYFDIAHFYSASYTRSGRKQAAEAVVAHFNLLRTTELYEIASFWLIVVGRSVITALDHSDKPQRLTRACLQIEDILSKHV